MRPPNLFSLLLLGSLLHISLSYAADCSPVQVPTPSIPTSLAERDITFVNEQRTEYTQERIPALRTTRDGRIGVNVKAGSGIKFFLLKPESLTSLPKKGEYSLWNPAEGSDTTRIFDTEALGKIFNYGGANHELVLRHVAICDPVGAINPRARTLNAGGEWLDEYIINLIAFTGVETEAEGQIPLSVWKLEFKILVSNPKTAQAKIKTLENTLIVPSKNVFPFRALLEPMITDDGRLLVARGGAARLEGFSDKYDILYGYNAKAPCDPDGWDYSSLKPILYAPHDPTINKKYGFARYPFRDTRGQLLVKNEGTIPDFIGTYPWIDRSGKNIFFHQLNRLLVEGGVSKYPHSCVDGGSSCRENTGNVKGFSMMGAWTHGKAVLLDNLLNSADFGVGSDPADQILLKNIYPSRDVRIASVRDNGFIRSISGHRDLAADNINIADSLENVFNYNSFAKPQLPRDVVWRIGRGHVTAEVAFDDYLDPRMLVFAPMNASFDAVKGNYLDGFSLVEGTCGPTKLAQGQYHGSTEIRLQNAATFLGGDEGRVRGPVRVEPVAHGGVEGRGLFLRGNAQAEFQVSNKINNRRPWFVGVFHRPERVQTYPVTILRVQNKFSLKLRSEKELALVFESGTEHVFEIPGSMPILYKWHHFALVPFYNSKNISIFVDGNLKSVVSVTKDADLEALRSIFDKTDVVIGSRQSGSKGWYDELKVFIRADEFVDSPGTRYNAEAVCNHARGTVVGFNSASEAPASWKVKMKDFANPSIAGTSFSGCFSNEHFEGAPVLAGEMTHARRLREEALNLSVTTYANEPLPSHSKNSFCISCHIPVGGSGLVDPLRLRALTPDALEAGIVTTLADHRRRPMQSPKIITGRVPKNWVLSQDNQLLPEANKNCAGGSNKCYIDAFILPFR